MRCAVVRRSGPRGNLRDLVLTESTLASASIRRENGKEDDN